MKRICSVVLALAGLWYLIAGIASTRGDAAAPSMTTGAALGVALLAAAALLGRRRST